MSTGPASRDADLPRFGRARALGFGLALLVLGAAFTAPLAWHLRDGLPYAAVPPPGREVAHSVQGDYLQFYYYLWLVRDRLAEGASILRDPYQFAVDGPRPNHPNIFVPAALLFLPLSVLGPVAAYNVLVLLSFPLTGVATAVLARRYGASPAAAAVAGTLLACFPYRVGALLGGHPAGLAYALVPLVVWGLEGALAGSLVGGAACAAALFGLALMEPHFVYFAALALPVYGLARVGLPAWRGTALGVGWPAWATALAIAAGPATGALGILHRRGWDPAGGVPVAVGLLIAILVLATWQLLAGVAVAAGLAAPRAAARRSLLACLPWILTALPVTGRGARVATVALVAPLVIHAAWLLAGWRRWWPGLPVAPVALAAGGLGVAAGFMLYLHRLLLRRSVTGGGRTLHEVLLFSPTPDDLFTRVNPAAGRVVYPGLVALLVAAAGAIALGRRPPEGRRRVLWAYLPLLLAGLVISLGPRLEAFPLFEVAFRLVPSWNFIRQPAKAQVLAGLGLAILVAVGIDGLRAGRRTRAGLALALALGIVVDYHPWRPAGVSILPTGGPEFAAVRAAGPRALWVPFWPGDSAFSGLYLYATTLTRVPMLNGYSAWLDRSYLTDVYRPLETVNLGVVGEAEAEVLRRYGVRQLVLARDAFPPKVSPFGPAHALAQLRASPYLEPLETPDGDWQLYVFRVRPRPRVAEAAPPPSSPLGVFWEAESLSRATGRIVKDAGASNGRVTRADAGRDAPGFVVFGQYRLLPPGAYRAHFRLKGDGATVEVQAATRGGRQILGSATVRLTGGERFVEMPVTFAMPGAVQMEYRVHWDGAGWVAVDTIAAAFADAPDPAPAFEVEALVHALRDRADPEASGGQAGLAVDGRTARDVIWAGPFRRYPPGRYRLWVRLKLDGEAGGPVARCSARRASGGELGGRELDGAEIGAPGRYVELAVPFTVTEPAVLEFPCVYRGGVDVWFDRLRVERIDGEP